MRYNDYTYTLLPVVNRGILPNAYKNGANQDTYPAINGYIVIDAGEALNLQQRFNAVYSVCAAHNYPADVIDVLKQAPAREIAEPLAVDDANTAVPWTLGEDYTQEQYDAYRASWQSAYDTAYAGHYATALASVTVSGAELSHAQALDFMDAYAPELDI